jgi:ABC-type uncharacterized transport system permease subunit
MVNKISDMLTKDNTMAEKIQKNIIISLIAGIAALVIGFYVFGNKKIENKIAKYGFVLAGAILLVYSLICNWDAISDATKLIFIGCILVALTVYSYRTIKNKKAKNEKKD